MMWGTFFLFYYFVDYMLKKISERNIKYGWNKSHSFYPKSYSFYLRTAFKDIKLLNVKF